MKGAAQGCGVAGVSCGNGAAAPFLLVSASFFNFIARATLPAAILFLMAENHDSNRPTATMSDPVESHRGWLMRLAHSRLSHSPVGDTTLAEDVVQEVSLAALRSPDRPTAGDELKHWLCRVTLRQCALALRGIVRRSNTVKNARSQAPAASPIDDPIYWLIASEDQMLVRRAMSKLDADLRQVLELKYIEQNTYHQIAGQLGGTRHAIEYLVLKARRELRQQLNELGLDPAKDERRAQREPKEIA